MKFGQSMNTELNALTLKHYDENLFCSSLPFSQTLHPNVVRSLAKELLRSLDLSAQVQLITGNGSWGLHYERLFRLNWWANGREPLRSSLQKAKTKIYARTRVSGNWEQLTNVWQLTDRLIHSQVWRKHLRFLAAGLPSTEYSFLCLIHQIAQQVWSRAARWNATARGNDPNPFLPVLKLLMAKALPLGCWDGHLWICLWDHAAPNPSEVACTMPDFPVENKKSHIFLSTSFRNTVLTSRWEDTFRLVGWETLHGPVNEEIVPPEFQLGKRIQTARAVVALIDEVDEDFGLPWWMFQELDYASAHRKPVAIVSQSVLVDQRLATVCSLKSTNREMWNPTQDHGLWAWLGTQAT